MLLFSGATGPDEAIELARAHALVRRCGAGELDEAIHIYRPLAPAVVFGRRDVRLPGFPAARRSAIEAGFQVAVRSVGGRAVAYTQNAIVIDHVRHETDAAAHVSARFAFYGDKVASTLRGLGVDARVGAVPGEYCPGAQSVNARGVTKLVGTAQRVVRDAWLFSMLITVDDHLRLRRVLQEVYAHLELEFDPASVGSVRDEVPTLDHAQLEEALLADLGIGQTSPARLDPATMRVAQSLVEQHRL